MRLLTPKKKKKMPVSYMNLRVPTKISLYVNAGNTYEGYAYYVQIIKFSEKIGLCPFRAKNTVFCPISQIN